MKEKAIEVLVVKPNESPLRAVISNSKDEFEDMIQGTVKEYLPHSPFPKDVAFIMNQEEYDYAENYDWELDEEDLGESLNRVVYSLTEDGVIEGEIDIYGDFLIVGKKEDSYVSLTEEQMKFYEKEFHIKEETIEKSLEQEQKNTIQVSVPSPDPFSKFSVEIASMQDESKSIKLELPVEAAVIEDTLEKLTGKRDGTEYVLLEGECPYFDISRHDELPLLNKISEISNHLTNDQKILLKNWCEHWEKDFCTDLTEITNAALQMNKVLYVEGIKNFDELGKAIVVTTDLLPDLDHNGRLPKIEKNISNYIDFEAIGRDYNTMGDGTNYPMMLGEKVLGYVLDDSEVNPQKFTKEQLMEMDTDKLMFQSNDFIKESFGEMQKKNKNRDKAFMLER